MNTFYLFYLLFFTQYPIGLYDLDPGISSESCRHIPEIVV